MYQYLNGAITMEGDDSPFLHVFMQDPETVVYHAGEESIKLPLRLQFDLEKDLADNEVPIMIQRPMKISSNSKYTIESIYHSDIQTFLRDSLGIDIPFCAPIFRIRSHIKEGEPDKIFTPVISQFELLPHAIYDEAGAMYDNNTKEEMLPYTFSIIYFTEGYEKFFDDLYAIYGLFFT